MVVNMTPSVWIFIWTSALFCSTSAKPFKTRQTRKQTRLIPGSHLVSELRHNTESTETTENTETTETIELQYYDG